MPLVALVGVDTAENGRGVASGKLEKHFFEMQLPGLEQTVQNFGIRHT